MFRYLIPVLMTGCSLFGSTDQAATPATSTDLAQGDWQMAPPGLPGPLDRTLVLTQTTPTIPGAPVTLQVSGAQPGQVIGIVRSELGPGPSTYCPGAIDFNCMEVGSPTLVRVLTADGSGVATTSMVLPPATPAGATRWYQAGAARNVVRGVNANISNTVEITVPERCIYDDFMEDPADLDSRTSPVPVPFTGGTASLVLCGAEQTSPGGCDTFQDTFGGTGDTGNCWPSSTYTVNEVDAYEFTVPAGHVLHAQTETLDVSAMLSSGAGPNMPDMNIQYGYGWNRTTGVVTSSGTYDTVGNPQYVMPFNVTPDPQTITLEVSALVDPTQATGVPYRLRFKTAPPCAPDFHEPNDGAATATDLSPANRNYGTGIVCAGDEDWFHVPSSVGPTADLFFWARGGLVDVEIYDSGSLVTSFSTTDIDLPGTQWAFYGLLDGDSGSGHTFPVGSDTYVRVIPTQHDVDFDGVVYNVYIW